MSVNSYLFGEFGNEKTVPACCVTHRVAFLQSSILGIVGKCFIVDSANFHFFCELGNVKLVVLSCCVTRRVAFLKSCILGIVGGEIIGKDFKVDSVNCHFFW